MKQKGFEVSIGMFDKVFSGRYDLRGKQEVKKDPSVNSDEADDFEGKEIALRNTSLDLFFI